MGDSAQSTTTDRMRLTERQYAAIGRVAVTWAEVEMAMEGVLARLALAPSLLGYILTDKLGPENRIGAIQSLIHVHRTKYASELVAEDLLAELKHLLTTIRMMKDDRNYIVHSVWGLATQTQMSRFEISETARSGQDTSISDAHDIEQIEMFGDEIRRLADRLWRFFYRIPGIDGALLDKLQSQEERSRRRPYAESTRQVPRKKFARLPQDGDGKKDQ